MKQYQGTLTVAERQSLHAVIAAGKAAALKRTPARLLLQADAAAGGPAWTADRIPERRDRAAAAGGVGPTAAVRRRVCPQRRRSWAGRAARASGGRAWAVHDSRRPEQVVAVILDDSNWMTY
ncbi:MAG TPA: hypothetical protein VEL76_32385 [Gemmataceae bacterium]|nr:hypothetical protein [Gemmataceae bacterium]